MARPVGEDQVEVAPGVRIYLHDNGVWRVRFRLDGAKKAVRQSLKTKDQVEAKRLALEKYDQARLRELSGKPQHAVSFEMLCTEYLASLPKGGPKKYHEGRIRLYLSPYFKSRLPDVSEMAEDDVWEYVQWRRTQLTKAGEEPKADTINRENVVLRGLIKFAVRKRYLTRYSAPDVPNLKANKDRRPNFTRDQLKTLIETAEARIDQTKNAVTREQRQLLYDWIVVLLDTGLRTGETTKLQWSDVFIDVDEPYLHAKRGKTKPRDVVLDDPAADSLKAIRSRQQSYLSKQGKKLTKKHHVFSFV
ncbi:MAG: tyrosine-type recombinase/integrase [Alphaproteobacteria bacterium]|nr:tyrosine-type recombinase/integrase [Alphaproteobacteria bacterium]